jgi:hypothetical protein
MLRINVSVGNVQNPLSPLLMNPMTEATLDMLRARGKKQVKTDWKPEDEAATKLFRDPDGRIAIPATNLLACLVNAGRKVKYGKVQLSTAETSMIPSIVSIEEEYLTLNGNGTGVKENPPFVVDKRRGCNPADGVAVCLIRPKFMHWGFDCTLLVDDAEIGEDTAYKLVEIAGKYQGLGDFRPSKRGPFGRFEVLKWRSQKLADQSSAKDIVFLSSPAASAAPVEKKTGRGRKGSEATTE